MFSLSFIYCFWYSYVAINIITNSRWSNQFKDKKNIFFTACVSSYQICSSSWSFDCFPSSDSDSIRFFYFKLLNVNTRIGRQRKVQFGKLYALLVRVRKQKNYLYFFVHDNGKHMWFCIKSTDCRLPLELFIYKKHVELYPLVPFSFTLRQNIEKEKMNSNIVLCNSHLVLALIEWKSVRNKIKTICFAHLFLSYECVNYY